jgi:hypothetical protein
MICMYSQIVWKVFTLIEATIPKEDVKVTKDTARSLLKSVFNHYEPMIYKIWNDVYWQHELSKEEIEAIPKRWNA